MAVFCSKCSVYFSSHSKLISVLLKIAVGSNMIREKFESDSTQDLKWSVFVLLFSCDLFKSNARLFEISDALLFTFDHTTSRIVLKLCWNEMECFFLCSGGRNSIDANTSPASGNSSGGSPTSHKQPLEVVNCMKTNLAINHLFVLNKDHAKTQLALTPSTGIDTNQPVNHLTIKPYIPPDPLLNRRNSSQSPTDEIYRQSVSSPTTKCSPLKLSPAKMKTLSDRSRVKRNGT